MNRSTHRTTQRSTHRTALAAGLAALTLTAAAATACGGRDARHIPVVEPYDAAMDCQALNALIVSNNSRIQQLYDEHDRASDTNVAIGVVGALLFWPALFALDTGDAERVEARALSDRNLYLANVARQKDCHDTATPIEVKFPAPPPAEETRQAGLPG